MRKYIIATAAMATCGIAAAQSSVTLFGVLDAGVAYIKGTGAGHATGLVAGGNSNSRLGFRGSEDLGGGLLASFWLEGQVSNDVGGGSSQTSGFDFARRSTVSLSSPMGELRLGRDYAMNYWNMVAFDSFGQRGLGSIETAGSSRGGEPSYIRTGNSVAYYLPTNLGGFYGSAQYAFGEQQSNQSVTANAAGISTSAASAATDRTGSFYGARIGYNSGPLHVGGSYGVFGDAVRTVGTSFYAEDYKIGNLGASYDFGILKSTVYYQNEKVDGRSAVAAFKFETLAVGATVPIGAGLIRAQFARYNQSNTSNDFSKVALGYVYNLSKRSRVYADVARLSNKGTGTTALTNMSSSVRSPTPSAGGNSTGITVGMVHSF
jgi:predicted porin